MSSQRARSSVTSSSHASGVCLRNGSTGSNARASRSTLRLLVGGKVNVDLIDRNWADILRVAATMAAGTTAEPDPAQARRVSHTAEPDPAQARRVSPPERAGAALWEVGRVRDRTEGQHYRLAGLNLLAAIIIYWNTLKLGKAVLTRKNAGLDVPAEIPGPRLAARMGTHQPDRRIPVARCRPTRAEYSRGSHHRAEWSPGRARRMAVRCPTPHQSRARLPRADPGNPPPPRHHRGCPRDRQRPTTAAQEALVDDPRRPRPLRSRDAAQRSDQGRAAHHVPRASSMYATRA